jgi:Cu/Ag efflux pump CusA
MKELCSMHCMPTRAFLMGPAVIGILAAFTDVQISLAGGERAGEQAPIELVVDCPAHSAEEVERQTTLPLESALADLPHLRRMRTLSAPGRTHVALFFEPAAPMAEMRRKVAKRIQRVKDLPQDVIPELSAGDRFQDVLRFSLMPDPDQPPSIDTLCGFHERIVREHLLRVSGVAAVHTSGAALPRYQIQPDPDRLARFGINVAALHAAISKQLNASGDNDLKRGQLPNATEALDDLVVANLNGNEVRVRDLAVVRLGLGSRESQVGQSWRANDGWLDVENVVQGIVWASDGADARQASDEARKTLADVANKLPADVRVFVDPESFTASDAATDVLWLQGQFGAAESVTPLATHAKSVRAVLRTFDELLRIVTIVGPIARDRPGVIGTFQGRLVCRPRSDWPKTAAHKAQTLDGLRAALQESLDNRIRGAHLQVTSDPPGAWWNWWSAGSSEQVQLTIRGPDLDELNRLAEELCTQVRGVPGVDDAWVVPPSASLSMSCAIDRDRCATLGVNVADVERMIEAATDGLRCGRVAHGENTVDVILRWPGELVRDVTSLEQLAVPSSENVRIRLGDLARAEVVSAPPQILREQGSRVLVIKLAIRERDRAAVVARARSLTERLFIQPYSAQWSGQ